MNPLGSTLRRKSKSRANSDRGVWSDQFREEQQGSAERWEEPLPREALVSKASKNIGRRNALRSISGRKAALGRRRGRLCREVMRRKIAGGSDARRNIRGSDAAFSGRIQKPVFASQRQVLLRGQRIRLGRKRCTLLRENKSSRK